ncbi:MAG TPA: NUDIX hydrolase [Desulfobacterales bacterium]|nr:NUDIX hydrolase [Desulfobacterales bacterium]
MGNESGTTNTEYPDLPRAAIGVIVFKEDKILLIRRGKAPSEGMWAVPGGSVKLGETFQEAAEREIREETGLTIRAREPVFTFDVIQRDNHGRIRFHYVIVDLIADYLYGEPKAGDDALDVRWVSSGELKCLDVSKTTRKVLRERFGFGS